jgi:hypothetical protein
MYFVNSLFPYLVVLFQYFVFDFHMAPAMLFDKIVTLTVSNNCLWIYVIVKR